MTRAELARLRDLVREEADRITAPKSREYTRGNSDALHNFKSIALRLGMRPEQVLAVYFYKHLDALFSMADGSADFDALSESPIGRAADAHNYLDLLFGLVAERMTPAQRTSHGMADAVMAIFETEDFAWLDDPNSTLLAPAEPAPPEPHGTGWGV